MLLAGVDPLRMYMYKEGMARFATVPYECSGQQNLNNVFIYMLDVLTLD